MQQSTAIIGSGIGGIAAAIRLSAKGHKVQVFEKAGKPGGKISERHQQGYRFDTGPSLFTLPELVDELFRICGEKPEDHFSYQRLDASCRYFWDDGSRLTAWHDSERFALEAEQLTGVPAQKVLAYLKKSQRLYALTAEVFLFNSFHKWKNYLKPAYRRSLLHLHELDAFTSMHTKNSEWFSHPKLVQLFDRYATYNGSNPWKAPATLNIIAHLEHNLGAYFPKKGMYHIVQSLYQLALRQGVEFYFNSPVERILTENSAVKGLISQKKIYPTDSIVSNIDVINLYQQLLPEIPLPRAQASQDRSSSALIFYWGMDRTFTQLGLHNIFFSNDYQQEFAHLSGRKTISDDPTVYVFISARAVPGDAPRGKENWFVMINVPENRGQDWDNLIRKARADVLRRLSHVLKTSVEDHIVSESVADPRSIEADTGSYRGALYGLSSNSRFAAFNRHPNFSRKIRGLYFTGGSVHPGGGIPLCLASARIVDQEFPHVSK